MKNHVFSSSEIIIFRYKHLFPSIGTVGILVKSKVVSLRLFCVILLGMMSLSGLGRQTYPKIYPSERLFLSYGLSSTNFLAPSPSSVNVTFIDPGQKDPLQHYLSPPKFKLSLENTSVITGLYIALQSNDTETFIIFKSTVLEGVITRNIWDKMENGVIEIIAQASTSEDMAFDSVWIIKDSFGDFLSRTWFYFLSGVVLIISTVVVANYLVKKRNAFKSKKKIRPIT